jgi:hypothetical protein
MGCGSDLLGLRLSLPRSRPAQISEGTLNRTEQLERSPGSIATVVSQPMSPSPFQDAWLSEYGFRNYSGALTIQCSDSHCNKRLALSCKLFVPPFHPNRMLPKMRGGVG